MSIKKRLASALLAVTLAFPAVVGSTAAASGDAGQGWTSVGTGELQVNLIGRYVSGAKLKEAGAEIVQYDPKSKKAFIVNGAEKAVDILDLTALKSQSAVQELKASSRIKLQDLIGQLATIGDITSVAVSPKGDFIALSLPADPKHANGKVVLLDMNGKLIKAVEVGALPDMLTFTPDGNTILVANEGEPSDDYTNDPEGTVSIIDVSKGAAAVTQESVTTVGFKGVPLTGGPVKLKPGSTPEKDYEPEYIAVHPNGKFAYVTLQEVNAIAVLDIAAKKFTKVVGLGVKRHYELGNGFDASDKAKDISIQPWPVLGLYMPDGIDIMTDANGKTYLFTANEGDSREYKAYAEEARVSTLKDKLALKAEHYPGLTQKQLDEVSKTLLDETKLGRLKITTELGKNKDGKFEALYSFGARSFSVWDADTLAQVYDSGDDFEQILAEVYPDKFNVSNDDNTLKSRSDDKGPEPEDVKIGKVGDQTYAFVGLERQGGVMAYNVTNPAKPQFAEYFNFRDLSGKEIVGDSGPEGFKFIPASDSPTGSALLLVANEVTGTVSIYEVKPGAKKKLTTVTILHTNDIHARFEETANDGMGYSKIATLVNYYRSQNPNTLVLDAGDTLHGTTFATLVRGESIAKLVDQIGYDMMTAGNHDFNFGYERLLEIDAMTKFPILAANVRKTSDNSRILKPYIMKEVAGIKFGILGLATPETTYKTHPKNVEGLNFVDPSVEAKLVVDELKKQGADVIIAVAHLGVDKESVDTSEKLAKEVPGIDLIVDGHSHTVFKNGLMGANNTLIVSTGEYAKNLGVVELTFEGKKLVDRYATLVSKDAAALVAPDAAIEKTISDIKKGQEKELNVVVGQAGVKLEGDRGVVRTKESNLGNLITDAMLDVTGADFAITNGGGIRASINAGPITKGNVITVLPFGNYIQTKQVKGSDVKAALENGVDTYPGEKGAFPQVAGMTFAIDESKPKGERVHSITIKGQPLELERMYVMATNDFMAAGGDNYTMFKSSRHVGDFPALDEALIAYIQKKGTVAPAVEGRISVKAAAVQAPAAAKTYTVVPGDSLWAIGVRFGTTWQTLRDLNNLANPQLIFPGQLILLP